MLIIDNTMKNCNAKINGIFFEGEVFLDFGVGRTFRKQVAHGIRVPPHFGQSGSVTAIPWRVSCSHGHRKRGGGDGGDASPPVKKKIKRPKSGVFSDF